MIESFRAFGMQQEIVVDKVQHMAPNVHDLVENKCPGSRFLHRMIMQRTSLPLIVLLLFTCARFAESGEDAWLR